MSSRNPAESKVKVQYESKSPEGLEWRNIEKDKKIGSRYLHAKRRMNAVRLKSAKKSEKKKCKGFRKRPFLHS